MSLTNDQIEKRTVYNVTEMLSQCADTWDNYFDNKDVIGTVEFYSKKLGKPKHEILGQDRDGQLWAIWQIALDVAMYTHPRFSLWMSVKMDRKFTTGSSKIEYDDSKFRLHNDDFGDGEFARLARFLQNRWDI